jgi:hypothetical protein
LNVFIVELGVDASSYKLYIHLKFIRVVCNTEDKTMKLNKKTAVLALALVALVAIVSASGYFIISNYIHKEATIKRINGIEVTIVDFPDEVIIGKEYTFTTTTANVLDQELKDLTTYIVVWMPTEEGNVTLRADWLHVYYEDASGGFDMVFEEREDGSLISTIGPWTAPMGYNVEATITFSLEGQSLPSELPDGTVCMDVWVESPSFP